jgi:tRNA (guanosine-2'-O-)-methyltransferase
MTRQEILDKLKENLTDNRKQRISEVAKERTRFIHVVVEDLMYDRNAGAVFRTCDCFGIQEVSVIENNYSKRVAELISKGSEKWLDVSRYDSQDSDNSLSCIKKLKSSGYQIVATTPHNSDVDLNEFEITQKTALIFGTENTGLSEQALELADVRMRIPIYGFTESFNISVSAALILQNLVHKLRKSSLPWQLSDVERIELEIEWVVKSMGEYGKLLLRQYEQSS